MTPNPADPILALEQVVFRWPQARQDCVNLPALQINPGESVFLRGASGSGKSTLLSLVAGVLVPQQGWIRLLGTDLAALTPSRRDRMRADHVGYIFQQFNLLPYRTALDNVLLPCVFSKRRAALARDPRRRAQELLERVGLRGDLMHRRAHELSVGQQQRVAAARALIGSPELVIADEPTSALDDAHRDDFMALLKSSCAEARSALLFVSHDARLAPQFSRVIELTQGA
ncbi:ABC transporter ATP-binding protein [Roseateles sp. SL47]|uniref:ABC transporter ATP-binding protein n=1 Tax=Roseateles sp. SL47 TaxID=2995138 RepID=UPI00226DC193|nr:ABC transporter ATP-binding protein [Roseateles sp. SL47]WAC71718.1 ABC transporter ATP-binding protein [Roseateles sp. SL47]